MKMENRKRKIICVAFVILVIVFSIPFMMQKNIKTDSCEIGDEYYLQELSKGTTLLQTFVMPGNRLNGIEIILTDFDNGVARIELYKKDGISVFFDIGTNGELVIGNKDFLLCGAGAAGPALEGGVVHTGMRADAGAVDSVRIRGGKIHVHVIGNSSGKISPKGICGSGIVDLIAELFLEGWIDIRGKFSPEKTNLIQKREGQLCIEYAPGLYFYQKDIDEFILTKAAAHIMVEIMLRESGLELNQADRFYAAGSFGKYVSVESAITIGMYPDMEREKMINAGNSSLEGAQKLLLNKELLADIDQILEEMTYIQFAEVDDFLEQMVAAQTLPHTDYKKYPTVMEKLKKRQNICFY